MPYQIDQRRCDHMRYMADIGSDLIMLVRGIPDRDSTQIADKCHKFLHAVCRSIRRWSNEIISILDQTVGCCIVAGAFRSDHWMTTDEMRTKFQFLYSIVDIGFDTANIRQDTGIRDQWF